MAVYLYSHRPPMPGATACAPCPPPTLPMWMDRIPAALAASAMVNVLGGSCSGDEHCQTGPYPCGLAPVMQSRSGVRPVSAADRVGEHTAEPL